MKPAHSNTDILAVLTGREPMQAIEVAAALGNGAQRRPIKSRLDAMVAAGILHRTSIVQRKPGMGSMRNVSVHLYSVRVP